MAAGDGIIVRSNFRVGGRVAGVTQRGKCSSVCRTGSDITIIIRQRSGLDMAGCQTDLARRAARGAEKLVNILGGIRYNN